MGYNLTIGEFKVDIVHDERQAYAGAGFPEHKEWPEEAPLNSKDDQGNTIFPSYGVWSDFCKCVGLHKLFYAPRNEDDSYTASDSWWVGPDGDQYEGLLSQHPGAFELTGAHLTAFEGAKKRYLATPEPRAGLDISSEIDYNLRRLDWLIFWTKWALEHCEYPTFGNS